MIKRILITIALVCLMTMPVQAAGFTIWGLTEQANLETTVTGRIGYMLGVGDNGGLEPFIGSVWRVNDSEPQVIVVGAIQHLQIQKALLDPKGCSEHIGSQAGTSHPQEYSLSKSITAHIIYQ